MNEKNKSFLYHNGFTSGKSMNYGNLKPLFISPYEIDYRQKSIGQANHNYKIYKKITKFVDLYNSEMTYTLFLCDESGDNFEILTRTNGFPITENISCMPKFDNIDTHIEGEILSGEDLIYHEKICSNKKDYTWITKIPINIHDNQYLVNLYGNEEIYKALPSIGESIECTPSIALRQIQDGDDPYDSIIRETDNKIFLSSSDRSYISDYIIYTNKYIEDNAYNHDLFMLYKAQQKYDDQLLKVCEEIIALNKHVSYDMQKLYSELITKKNTNIKYKYHDTELDFVQLNVIVTEVIIMKPGDKLSARYGNKTVSNK